MKFLLIGLIRFYQVFLAPLLRFMNGGHGHCRHDPTCSNYAIEALRVHGVLKGSGLAAWRLLRCHPWGTHGYDPVPPRRKPRHVGGRNASTGGCGVSCGCAEPSGD